MFNMHHPVSDLIRRMTVNKPSDSVKEQLRRLLMTAIKLLETQGRRQRKAIFEEFTKELTGTLNHAVQMGVIKSDKKGFEIKESDFVMRR
jgi:hypothetical protein